MTTYFSQYQLPDMMSKLKGFLLAWICVSASYFTDTPCFLLIRRRTHPICDVYNISDLIFMLWKAYFREIGLAELRLSKLVQ